MKDTYHPTQTRRRATLTGFLLALVLCLGTVTTGYSQTVVDQYGQLRVLGNRIVDKNGNPVQLRGMSLYWSQWIGKFYNADAVRWLRDDWRCTVVRAAMAVDNGGYATNPAEKNKVIAVVDAAISLGIYVIIDFHVHEAQNYQAQARTFFAEMAQRYGNRPNVIYEIWNEPLDVSWAGVIKPYHQSIVSTIRQYDPDNIIVCGTRFYSQEVEEAALNPVTGSNIAYTLHYYAATHKQWLRDAAQRALNRGVALFVTEYGTTEASGNGFVDEAETRAWWAFLDQNKVSHANWSVADISESSAALQPGASAYGGWTSSQIKPSGQLVRNELRAKYVAPVAAGLVSGATYRITARHSNLVLDVSGASTANGAAINQWSGTGSTNQQWVVTSVGGGYYTFRAVHSGKNVDINAAGTADGTAAVQYTPGTGYNQQFRLEDAGGGYYRVVARHSNKCLDIAGVSTVAGAALQQWTCGTGANQQFRFDRLSTARLGTGAETAGAAATVYPNPSGSTFLVKAPGRFAYIIHDQVGKLLESGKGENQCVAGGALRPGLYLIRVHTQHGPQVIKAIKQ
ncbi:MAG: GH5_2 / GH5 / CBM13 / GH5_35 [uncultured Cytophagales bacterium]|uniref:GH5_2 / GH5 / CBM13 / GH5_35 n=1 Tax=uncultured Cytophagales bacterium TaxID=158755 RepID=A0A6J4LHB9_9SPHI|nr:MAG: GH5_2 / GH5 / CBM13 / GH5_35 [uncultured Cytophagales bacterium]